jgi:hypothetical protein
VIVKVDPPRSSVFGPCPRFAVRRRGVVDLPRDVEKALAIGATCTTGTMSPASVEDRDADVVVLARHDLVRSLVEGGVELTGASSAPRRRP